MNEKQINTTSSISYLGCPKSKIQLAQTLSDFKTQFIKEFALGNQMNEDDVITVYYKQDEKRTDVKEQEDYEAMLESFAKAKNAQTVYVETEKIPIYFEGEKSIEFEDEIKNVVERELRIAANNIKKCLTTNLSLSNSKKVRVQTCKECKKQIIGYLYKKVSPTENDSYYCELCSTKVEEPMFKIN